MTMMIPWDIDSEPALSPCQVFSFYIPAQRARDLVEKDIEKVEKEKATLEKEMEAVSKKMKKLKSTLYGKFGNSINLEEWFMFDNVIWNKNMPDKPICLLSYWFEK